MNYKKIRVLALGFIAFAGSFTAFGQDLIASQSPIDRRLKSVDSVTLRHLIEIEKAEEEDFDLYRSWNTESAHCYANAEMPDSFKIDLRSFRMPTTSRNVTSRFGYRRRFGRMHNGLDVKVYTGDTIYAAFNGKVRIVRDEGRRKGYGKYVVIRHDNGLETFYAHLSKHLVAVNEEVKAGDPIGLGGNTGRSYGSHLHFETRFLGKAINPELLFDFPNQDMKNDYYVFYNRNKSKQSQALASNTVTKNNSASSSSKRYYKVKKGDSLYTISKRVGKSINYLCSANRISQRSTLRPGQILKY